MQRSLPAITLGLPLMFWACLLWAQEMGQDWIPQEIRLPDDMEVVIDRAIGSATRMFSFATGEDVEALFAEWRAALEESGYVVESTEGTVLEQHIQFSGEGIGNAKITVSPSSGDERAVVEFDASLRN